MNPHAPTPRVLPVIHLLDAAQGASEAVRAFEAGATGVFLIHHGGDPYRGARLTLEAVEEARRALDVAGFARPWLGVNLLGKTPTEAFMYLHFERALGIAGVWCDGVAHSAVKHAGSEGVWAADYFAGVAFKYQPPSTDLARDALIAIGNGADVLTTSGPGTGQPCDPEKVRQLRVVADKFNTRVAVASGVSVANARELVAAGASHLLVASSIAENGDFHRMDTGKLRELLAEAAAEP